LSKESKTYVPNLNTFSDLIDRLIVEVNKLSYFENRKREEQKKEFPNYTEIAILDDLSRDCCEYRSMLKNAINETLKEIVDSGEYNVLKEIKTFSPPDKSIGEILATRCDLPGESLKDYIETNIRRQKEES
jgi:hypothetical protein